MQQTAADSEDWVPRDNGVLLATSTFGQINYADGDCNFALVYHCRRVLKQTVDAHCSAITGQHINKSSSLQVNRSK